MNSMDNRGDRYLELVGARKACRLCSGLVNASDLNDGRFDSPEIGPWSLWLGDLNARVVVVGQDWGDRRAFEQQAGRDKPGNATSQMLRRLLASVGIAVPDLGVTHTGESSGVFLTNAILCFKDDGCQGPVRSEWFQNCGSRFLKPLVETINPEVVVCLGERAYAAVLAAYQLPRVANWRAAVERPGIVLPNGSVAVAVYHCGQRILNTHRKVQQQFIDWERVGTVLGRAGRA